MGNNKINKINNILFLKKHTHTKNWYDYLCIITFYNHFADESTN